MWEQRWRGHRPPPHAARGRPPATPPPRTAHAATALYALTRAATVTEKRLCFTSSRPARHLGSPPCLRHRRERFHADRHLRPWNRLADATASTACALRTSPSHELGATATGRCSPRRSPPAAAHHHGGPHPGEFLGPNAPQIGSPRCPLALAPFPHCPHGRRLPESTGAAASPHHGSSSPVLPVGCQPEPSWPSCWTGPKQQWVSAHVHSSISHFSHI
jgi:hypothetical protein